MEIHEFTQIGADFSRNWQAREILSDSLGKNKSYGAHITSRFNGNIQLLTNPGESLPTMRRFPH